MRSVNTIVLGLIVIVLLACGSSDPDYNSPQSDPYSTCKKGEPCVAVWFETATAKKDNDQKQQLDNFSYSIHQTCSKSFVLLANAGVPSLLKAPFYVTVYPSSEIGCGGLTITAKATLEDKTELSLNETASVVLLGENIDRQEVRLVLK